MNVNAFTNPPTAEGTFVTYATMSYALRRGFWLSVGPMLRAVPIAM